MPAFNRLLCPVDFSSSSQKAFAFAVRLAESTAAELLLVHAFDVPAELGPIGQHQPRDPHLAEQLDALQTTAPIHVERLLHAGPPADVICWLAQERQCDLIVMGTHGRSGLTHLLFGSVTENVLRHARCPVLTIRDRPANEPPLPEPHVTPLKAPRLM